MDVKSKTRNIVPQSYVTRAYRSFGMQLPQYMAEHYRGRVSYTGGGAPKAFYTSMLRVFPPTAEHLQKNSERMVVLHTNNPSLIF